MSTLFLQCALYDSELSETITLSMDSTGECRNFVDHAIIYLSNRTTPSFIW